MIDADFADLGVDLWDERYANRPWQWFETRLFGLLSRPVSYAPNGAAIYRTRLARHFYQEAAFKAAERAHQRANQR